MERTPADTPDAPQTAGQEEHQRRYATPTGAPCPHQVRLDGTVDGPGDCYGCGYCLSVEAAAWPD